MKTGYQKLDAARDGVSTAASVGFTTYANTMPASQEEAPYLGRAQPGATADQSEVASLMVKRGSQMGTAEIVRIWNETAFHVKDTLLEGRALALDLAPLGIRVNCCAPGYIYTERWETLDPAKAARRRLNCPLRHEAKGSDIANVVAFLASDDSANMTGEIVTCDAGCSCQHMPEDVDV